MAKKVTVALVDDLDGTTAHETYEFSIQRERYQIDLSDKNAAKFNDALQPFVAAARRVSGKRKPAAGRTMSKLAKTPESQQAIRDWCNANGYPVATRGRIPREAQEAYDLAHESVLA